MRDEAVLHGIDVLRHRRVARGYWPLSAMRRRAEFYFAPQGHAHPSWAAAGVTIVVAASNADAATNAGTGYAAATARMSSIFIVAAGPDASPLADDCAYPACRSSRDIERFAEAVGRVMGGARVREAFREGSRFVTPSSPESPNHFTDEQGRLLDDSAALLAGPHHPPNAVSGDADIVETPAAIGARYLARGYARLAPALADRLRLLLPYEAVLSWMQSGDPPLDASEARALDRIWSWGRRLHLW